MIYTRDGDNVSLRRWIVIWRRQHRHITRSGWTPTPTILSIRKHRAAP